jgi:hypothetical protein
MVGQLIRYASCRIASELANWRTSSCTQISVRMASGDQLSVKRAGIIIIGDEILKGETQVE